MKLSNNNGNNNDKNKRGTCFTEERSLARELCGVCLGMAVLGP